MSSQVTAEPSLKNHAMSTDTQTQTSTDRQSGVVIIGAGLAGWGVVDAIRAKDKDIAITLVTADKGDRYHKPMLTMAISQNKTPADLIRLTGIEAAQSANITLIAQHKVTQIDSAHKRVTIQSIDTIHPTINNDAIHPDALHHMESNNLLTYDSLVLAMGAHPIFPPSFPEPLVWHVNHIERFGELQAQLSSGPQKIAIIGAGMVGTEIAEDLLKAGHQITLVDLNEAPLAQMLPSKATERVRQAIESQGIEFLSGSLVTSITKLDDGQIVLAYRHHERQEVEDMLESFTVDHVIVSTGLTVDPKLPESAGIKYDRRTGIMVDESTLQTSQTDIYAIGDCMSIAGTPCRYVAPLRAQAAIIADAILGQEHAGYEHKAPMIRLKNKAISVMTTGTPRGDGHWQVINESSDELVMEQHDTNGIVSATLTIKRP
ncbi:MAG: FAD-dependent oxidoreductase [Psychrobacter sp.]|nr:FAD-dependent oxidoreductase [Psychrobacter sp.]